VGDCIRREILKEKRAEYDAEIVSALGRQLKQEFGRGFPWRSLHYTIRFADAFPESGDCRITDTTIDLDPLHCPNPT